MKWTNGRQSGNVEDRRGMGGALPVTGGVGTLLVALAIYFLGGDPSVVLQPSTGGSGTQTSRQAPGNDEGKRFVSLVLGDTEDVWNTILSRRGQHYREPKLVLFSGRVQSACGIAGSSAGPFYCPADEKLYIDLNFYSELRNRISSAGRLCSGLCDCARSRASCSKPTGHDGQSSKSAKSHQRNAGESTFGAFELQADFYAGVWAHYAAKRGILEPGDIEEGLRAASAIGDDTLQARKSGLRGAGFVHARQFSAASLLVQERSANWRH